jgi:hypothetical protein
LESLVTRYWPAGSICPCNWNGNGTFTSTVAALAVPPKAHKQRRNDHRTPLD